VVAGGRDSDGSTIYVGRAFHEGDMLPAKVIPDKGVAYVCHNGEEHPKDNYEVREYRIFYIYIYIYIYLFIYLFL